MSPTWRDGCRTQRLRRRSSASIWCAHPTGRSWCSRTTCARRRGSPYSPPGAIIGFDLVRAPDGEFLVLEDNLRTPSGLAYLLAARDALRATLPPGLPEPRPIDPAIYELLAATLRGAR